MKKHKWSAVPKPTAAMSNGTKTGCGYVIFRFAAYQFEDHTLSTPMICRGFIAAGTAAQAANMVQEWLLAEDSVFSPLTVRVRGIRGGVTERFTGWEGITIAKMMYSKPAIVSLGSPQEFELRSPRYDRPAFVSILL